MKKYFLLLVFLLSATACNRPQTPIGDNITNVNFLYKGSVVEFDSCEYIVYKGYAAWHATHKGNCKFCQQRLEETIRKIAKENLK